jgi:hypothetical protein
MELGFPREEVEAVKLRMEHLRQQTRSRDPLPLDGGVDSVVQSLP